MRYYFFFGFIVFFITLQGCASQPVSLRDNIKPDYLELCLEFAGEIEIDDKLLYLDAVKSFIDEYNMEKRFYEVRSCSLVKGKGVQTVQDAQQRVTLVIQNTHFVSPSEQAMYVLISGVGIYSILSGGYGFAWAGLSTTTLGVILSPDITEQSKTTYKQFSSWPYFHDLSRVKQKQMKRFQQFMFELFNELKVKNAL